MLFVIEPHRGIGPISFGMSREDVAVAKAACGGGRLMKKGKEIDCYFENAFQIEFGDNGKADFVEVYSGISTEVLFDDQDVFNLHADELLDLIRVHESEDPELSEPDDSYVFSGIIVTLWGRDKQYDYNGGEERPVFAAVGLGAPSYLVSSRAIRHGS